MPNIDDVWKRVGRLLGIKAGGDGVSDWYKDETANPSFEKEMIDRYVGRKLEYRIWQERAERMKATATRLRGLLRRCQWDREYGCPICEQSFEHATDCELAKELADAVGSEG